MPLLTEEFRQQELDRGRRSFWYFLTAICGQVFEDKQGNPTYCDLHLDLCHFLEGRAPHHPWNRALVCAFRGAVKSVIATSMYALWRCLYIENFSALIISNSADNARDHHFLPIVDLLTSHRRSEYIRWLFAHRFPAGMEGTTSEHLNLVRTSAFADFAISWKGVDSKLEGIHPGLVILDDPEGADSEKGGVASEAAWNAYKRCIPLAFPPEESQILLVATPHGPRPIVYRIRDRENWQNESDNARTSFKIWWREILDEHGKSRWPARFPAWYIETLRKDAEVWDTQYMLRRQAGVSTLFEKEAIKDGLWRHLTPDRRVLSYRGLEWNPDAVDEKTGYVIPEVVETTINLRELRYYIHFDPLHKEEAAKRTRGLKHLRPTKAAIVVVGVAPDFHAFVLECWAADADLHKQVSELFRLYRKWCPYQVTWEPIGAQAWLKNYIEVQERSRPDFEAPRSLGHILPADAALPRLSTRLLEDEKGKSTKEWVHRELLSPWINHGTLHLHHTQETLLWQLDHAMEELAEVDLVDALAQGPRVWKAPVSEESERHFLERRRFVNLFVAKDKANKATGFKDRGWR